jgi:cytidine deaminase
MPATSGPDDLALFAAAIEARKAAFAPYSHFHVGAAIRVADGSIYHGANYESASYGLTLCAERSALVATQQAGAVTQIVAVAVTAIRWDPSRGEWITLAEPVAPCGACRQWLFEAAHRAGTSADFSVLCGNSDFSAVHTTSARTLLPNGFAL